MPVLINPQDQSALEVPDAEAQGLLKQGWKIPLKTPDGKPMALPYEDAIKSHQELGYQDLNDRELDDLLLQTKYRSGTEQIKGLAEGFVKGLAGAPIYTAAATATGLTTREKINERDTYLSEAETTGEVAGTATGIVTGTGLPGLVGKAGKAASVLGKVAGPLGKLFAQGLTEGMLYSASDQINERLLGDPETLGESLMSHVGPGALLGGGAALAFGSLGRAASKAGKLTTKAAEKVLGNEAMSSKAMDKLYDLLIDNVPLGPMRTPTRLAKGMVIDTLLKVAPSKKAVLDSILKLEQMAQKTTNAIENNAAGIFAKVTEPAINPEKGKRDETPTEPKMHRLGEMIMADYTDPLKLIDSLSNSTMALNEVAPEAQQALVQRASMMVSFLGSKAPRKEKVSLLDSDPKISADVLNTFNRYAQVVENPISVLNHVKSATLLPQDLETLVAVYPGLYQTMRTTVMDKLIGKMGKQKTLTLPYSKRMSLSLFLGIPLDSTLTPQSVLSNQQSFSTMHIQKQMNNQIQRASTTGMQRMDPTRDLTRSQRTISRR